MKAFIVLASLIVTGCSSNSTPGTSGDDTGSAGAQGPAGPQGSAGPIGVQGPQGPAGPQGPQGTQGSTGAAGAAGAQGPAGDTGAAGAVGAAGAQGPQGPQGPAGAAGAAGATGSKGATGAAGVSAYAYTANNVQLGLLVSAVAGAQTYVSLGDAFTLVPDGLVVSLSPTKVWYAGNECLGQAYVDDATFTQFAGYVYVGFDNTLYEAPKGAAANVAVGSFTLGGGASCQVLSEGIAGHALSTVGAASNLSATLPWHVVIQ